AITQEIEKTAARARAEIKEMAGRVAQGVEVEFKAQTASLDEALQTLQKRVSSFENELGGMVSRTVQTVENRLADYQDDVDSRMKSLEESRGDVAEARTTIAQEIEKTVTQSRAEIKEMAARVEEGFGAEMRQQAAQSLDRHRAWQADLEKRVGEFESEVKTRIASSEEALQGLGDSLRLEVEKTRKDSALAIEKETQTIRESLDASVRKSQREIETKLRELSAGLESGRKELGDVLDASRAEVVAWEGRVRQQLSETEVSVAEKISLLASEAQSSISSVHDDFTTQKDEMLAVFTQERAGLKAELKEIGERVASFEADLKRSSEATLDTIRGQMEKAGKGTTAAVEKELAALKETLESRSGAMHVEIDSRMKELAAQLEAGRRDVAAQAESALGAIRGSFASHKEELVAASSAERDALKKQIGEMAETIGTFDAELSRATDSTMEAIQVLKDALHEEVEKARGESSLAMEKDLSSLRESLEGASRKMQKEIETRMASIAGEMEANRKEVSQLLEASSTYVTAWEAKTRQRVSESESAIAKKLSVMEAQAGASVKAVKEAFAAQKEELLKASLSDREEFRNELGEIGLRISTLKADLTASSGETLGKLAAQAESLEAESQKRMRDFQADVDTRIKEYRQLLAESREKAEVVQEKLFARIDETYRTMSANIADIDKRVKSFTAQTRLFERADSLKEGLEASIEEMKKELAKLGAEKADLAEAELQLSRTKKLADETSTKLTRFLTEKRRIDEMEGEFKKLLTLSRDIDLKVNNLSGSHDALQQIQAKVREFEEMGKAVETGVERLDKKQQIITVTAEGVDKNFQRLETIEKTLKTTDQEAAVLEEKVRSLMSEYEMLAGRKKDAETAVEISGKL
ncbi:MAG TPA: hypothetical protein VMM82_07080, partial [Spirochaetia bacterium]|nr:hypothetical protein [Spirochaetia bacterium]